MNPFEMVVAIVAITAVASVVRARFGLRREGWKHRHGHSGHPLARPDEAETEAMRTELRTLKERVAVLERLATDGNSALEREFEKLRQQD